MTNIDFVVLWVDGNDPAWLAERQKYAPQTVLQDGGINRYRDWDLMRYWFRAVETFAPWVNKVFFVTWGHIPDFMNIHAPKLRIVKHEDFIPQQYLPTFNTRSIDLNLFRIPDLSESFVYFNDDMFLIRPAKPEDFFYNGLPCSYGVEAPLRLNDASATWTHAVASNLSITNAHFQKQEQIKKNRRKYISKHYSWHDNLRVLALERLYKGYFAGFKVHHGPAAFHKETYRDVWNAEPAILDTTCKEKFRAYNQVSQYVLQWWQIAKGEFYPATIDNLCCDVTSESIDFLCKAIEKQEHKYICLQDPNNVLETIDRLSARLQEAFESILPQKSEFEL